MTRFLATALLGLLTVFAVPVAAQECNTIEEDKALVEEFGNVEYLGVGRIPHTEGFVVFYATRDGQTVISPIVDGCVDPSTVPVGRFLKEIGV